MNSKISPKKWLIILVALLIYSGVVKADFTFGIPNNLGPIVNSSSEDIEPTISADGLSLLFSSNRSGGQGGTDLWITTRTTVSDPWGPPANLGATINSSSDEFAPRISSNGLSLYFADGRFFAANSTRPGGLGDADLWITKRASQTDPWGPPVNLGLPVNSPYYDGEPEISADGLSLFFDSARPGGSGDTDLWMSTRASVSDEWGQPVNLGPTVNGSGDEGGPNISIDSRALFFASWRPKGSGGTDLWMSTRVSVSDEWGQSVNLGPTVNSSVVDASPSISPDGSILFFLSNRSGGYGNYDLWQVSIDPIVDLNTDGIVDAVDMCIIVDNWGTDEPLCDIGPMPWGDGIVDVQDLIVLAEHLFEEIPPVE